MDRRIKHHFLDTQKTELILTKLELLGGTIGASQALFRKGYIELIEKTCIIEWERKPLSFPRAILIYMLHKYNICRKPQDSNA